MNSDQSVLLRILGEGFDKKAWHGPNLRGSIRGLSAADAAWRPAPGRHNIWEIVVHAAYWKYAVRRRLLQLKRGSFALKGSNWIPRPGNKQEASWNGDVKLLITEHAALMAAIRSMNASKATRQRRGGKPDVTRLIYGIAAHDIYHAGQIQLIKRLRRAG